MSVLDAVIMIDILLNIIHFQRVGNWERYLQAIKEFLPLCFVLNCYNYACNLSYHYIDMHNLKKKNPEAYSYLECGGFTASLPGNVHSQIPMDYIIEMTINRFSKETGDLTDPTEFWS